jgi:hypothetical protein
VLLTIILSVNIVFNFDAFSVFLTFFFYCFVIRFSCCDLCYISARAQERAPQRATHFRHPAWAPGGKRCPKKSLSITSAKHGIQPLFSFLSTTTLPLLTTVSTQLNTNMIGIKTTRMEIQVETSSPAFPAYEVPILFSLPIAAAR